jgi:GR25 family glycosyltransferase involved in LPS biosynthesis
LKNIFTGKNIEFVDDNRKCELSIVYNSNDLISIPFIAFIGEPTNNFDSNVLDLSNTIVSLISTEDKSLITNERRLYFPMFLNVGPYILDESPFKRLYINNERLYIASYIASHSPEHRDKMFKVLKNLDIEDKVHGLGKANHTKDIQLPNTWYELHDIYKNYLFGFAMESKNEIGYITEKIMNVYRGGAIPIYWGTSKVKEIFNPESFIYVNDYESFEKCAEDIMKIVNDKERLKKMQNTSIFNENAEPDYSKYYDTPSPEWVIDIAEKIKKNMNSKQKGGNETNKAYVINLDKRTDRWEEIQKNFKNSDIELERIAGIVDENPYKGCSMSFQKIIKIAKDKNLETVLIFEDDNYPIEMFNERWKTTKLWLDSNLDKWDIFNGSARIKDELSVKLEYELDNNVNLLSSTYILNNNWLYVNRSAYDRILEWKLYETDKSKCLDQYTGDKESFNVLFIYPFLSIQSNGYSDIEKENLIKDHDHTLRMEVLDKILKEKKDQKNLKEKDKIKAYVINLNRRTDRWEQIQKDFKDLPILLERFSAIENDNGHIGLSSSYLELVKKAKNENMESILILEDDCLPVKDFIERWNKVKIWLDNNKDKWNIFNGGIYAPIDLVEFDNIDGIKLYRSNGKGARAAHFVIIEKSAYDKVLEYNWEKDWLFDYYINSNRFKNILLYDTKLAGQHGGYSNTEHIQRETELNINNLKGGNKKEQYTKKNNKRKTRKKRRTRKQKGGSEKIHYITVSTKDTPDLQNLIKSAKKNMWDLNVLGLEMNTSELGHANKKFGMKLRLVKDYLSKCNSEDILLFTDAWDVLVFGTKEEVLERYKKFNKSIIFNAEKFCWPDEGRKNEYDTLTEEFPFLNSGGYIGKVKDIARFLDNYNNEEDIDDQRFWTDQYMKNRDIIGLDHKNDIFICCAGNNIKDYSIENQKLKYKDRYPLILHANGPGKETFINPFL